jgi:2,3-dihydroxybiphenyl 1,2-dioxygenase
MTLQSLGYVAIGSSALDDWTGFSTNLLGMQVTDRAATTVALRMDDRRQRLIIDADTDVPRCFGWEVADATALDALAGRVEAAGIAVKHEPRAWADRRQVAGLISFADPAGNRLELFHGAACAEEPFQPGRSLSGFRTGPLGFGHAVLTTADAAPLVRFYQEVLGFRLSDFMREPFKAFFFHINPRHHSLAIIETGREGLHHLMVELRSLDDVGQGYDLALAEQDRVAVTLGRHTNDYMTSFYARSPSQFLFEYGWGGRDIDPQWQTREVTEGPSLWGHERDWLPPEGKREAQRLRLDAAARGMRAPVHVLEGYYAPLSGTCAWWDSLSAA